MIKIQSKYKIVASPTLDCYQLLTLQAEREKVREQNLITKIHESQNSSSTEITPTDNQNAIDSLFESLFGKQYPYTYIQVQPNKNRSSKFEESTTVQIQIKGDRIPYGKGGPIQSLPKNPYDALKPTLTRMQRQK
jgi:hypothetical protein